MPWIQFPDQWANAEFDREKAADLIRSAKFAADDEAMKPPPVSRIRNPDGSSQSETRSEYTGRIIEAAVLYLLEMGLLVIPDGQDLEDYLPMQRMP